MAERAPRSRSCHSSHLSVCTCVPHRPGFRRVSLYFGSLRCLSTRLSGWTLLTVFRVCTYGFVLYGAILSRCVFIFSSICVSSPTNYLVLRCHFGSSAFACEPTLLPVPACGHSPQEYHLPRKVSSHFPLLACLVAVPGATRLQLCEPVATTALPLCPTSAVLAFFGPVPSFTGTVMVLGAGSCCFTVPRSAWSLRVPRHVSARPLSQPPVLSVPRVAWSLRSLGVRARDCQRV